jgi:hypothetical protein
MTLKEYHDKLSQFDWHYDQIDNYNEWKHAFNYHSKLLEYARLSDAHRKLFEAHNDYNKNNGPKPIIPLDL